MARWSAAGWSWRRPRTSAFADESAFFGLPEGQRGIFVGGGGTVRIQRVVGYTVMADMMLTGRLLSAAEGEREHIVRYVVPAGQALAKATRTGRAIAKNTPDTNWRITNVLPRVNDLSHDDGLFIEYLNSNMQRPPEAAERLREFVEGRAKPLVARQPLREARSMSQTTLDPDRCRDASAPRHTRIRTARSGEDSRHSRPTRRATHPARGASSAPARWAAALRCRSPTSASR